MKAHVITRITINSSAQDVFLYLTDLKYMHLWNPQVKELPAQKVLKLHSKYKTVSQVLGVKIEAANIVTRYDLNKELQIENETGTVSYIANFKLITHNDTVTLVCDTTVSSDSKAFAFTAPVLKLLARRELQTDLQALKIAVENNVSKILS
ncbi:hypothetical protein BH09PAT3_BH09PAT3_2370 [soil metagenome]